MNKVYCPGGDCPLKENCSRFKVIQPKENHFPKPPFKNQECEFFTKIEINESNPPQANRG